MSKTGFFSPTRKPGAEEFYHIKVQMLSADRILNPTKKGVEEGYYIRTSDKHAYVLLLEQREFLLHPTSGLQLDML
eukprot:6461105-Amphidinium_carterae.1